MITKEELKEYAKITNLNLGQAEKDYFQNILLFIIYQEYGKGIIFKGGTALKKCYGLDRFSEDLDFTCLEKIDIQKIEDGLKRFNLNYELEKKEYKSGLKITLRINGPLYSGIRNSLCKLILDFSFREKVILQPIVKSIGRFLEEVPSFDVFVMQEKEILAEKIRAIITRNKARDVYDLWFLLNKNINFDKKFIEKKLDYYKEHWNKKDFMNKLNMKESIWETELSPLLRDVPKFNKVKKKILSVV